MQLIFVRHGRPKVVEGDNDPVLSDAGRSQAEQLAAWLSQRRIERVVSSPMRRALDTAEPTRKMLGLDLEVVMALPRSAAADRAIGASRNCARIRFAGLISSMIR